MLSEVRVFVGIINANFAEYVTESFESSPSLAWRYPRKGLAQAAFAADFVNGPSCLFEQRETAEPWHVVFEVEPANRTGIAYSAFKIFNGVFRASGRQAGIAAGFSVPSWICERNPGVIRTYRRISARTFSIDKRTA